jgi:hypothetical protein
VSYEKNPDELGALWLKRGGKGDYMTGEINGVKVFCTPTNSANPKAPTWRVMKSKPKDADSAPASGHNLNEPIDDSSIPF